MDDDFRGPSPQPDPAANQQLYHEPELTGHVPQLDNSQYSRPLSGPLPNHPFNFDFPTLNIDGSLPDIAAYQPRRYPRTPPAALSSLGARARMERRDNMSESEASFADSQYDMIDDLSEISNDDHDTASLASNGDDGALTPEEPDSEDEAEESTLLLENEGVATPPSTGASFIDLRARMPQRPSNTSQMPPIDQIKAENDLIDSYTSEDLKTPRQSTIPTAFSSTYHRSKGKAVDRSAPSLQLDEATNYILLISERNVNQADVDLICTKVASCMNSPASSDESEHRVVRLPATPSGISLPSATVVCGQDSVSATVQHCVGAEIRSPGSYKLRILDFDGEHTSYFTIGEDAKIDLIKPRIAIFYLDETVGRNIWFRQAFQAVQTLNVPVLVIRDSALNGSHFPQSLDFLVDKVQLSLYYNELVEMDRQSLTDSVSELLGSGTTKTKKKRGCLGEFFGSMSKSASHKRVAEVSWPKVLFGLCLAVLPYLLLLVIQPAAIPAVELATRREGLATALANANITGISSKDLNITHLLPEATCGSNGHLDGQANSSPCTPEVRYQGLSPNHIIVSLPMKPRSPQFRCNNTQVFKSDGRRLDFNQTKLIEGVYDITFDADEAYGIVSVNILTKSPPLNTTATHNFGHRMLQRKTYDKVSTDVSKVVGKDVAVMRHMAKGITDKLSTELGAGIWATKNVTSELALYAAHELEVFGNTAASMFGKAAQASNQTATALSKDFVLMQKDLVRFTKDLSTTLAKAKSDSKAHIKARLALAGERAQGFKKVLQRRTGLATSAANKEVSKLGKFFDGARRKAGHKGCTKHTLKSTKALSMVAEPETSSTKAPLQPSIARATTLTKHEYKKAMQQLNNITKRIKKLQNQAGEKTSRAQLRKMKKEAKEYERTLQKMREDLERERQRGGALYG